MGQRPNQEVQEADEASCCLKLCIQCRKTKETIEFSLQTRSIDGYSPMCRACQAAYRITRIEACRAANKSSYEKRRVAALATAKALYSENALRISMKRYIQRAIDNPNKKRSPYRSKWNPEGLPLSELLARLETQIGEKI